MKPGVAGNLPRSLSASDNYLGLDTYGGGSDKTPYGPGIYGFNWWFNEKVGTSNAPTWPDAPADTFQANGHWGREVLTVIPSLSMVVAARGNWGSFEPGNASSGINQNLKLLAQAYSDAIGMQEEAEDFAARTGEFIAGDDANASGGQYIWVPNGRGSKWNLNESHKVEYRFDVEEDGYYRIKAKVYAPNDNDDSFYVKVDGEPSAGYLWDVLQNTTYAADYVSDRNGEDPIEVCLTGGTHTVGVYLREDGTRLDTIRLEFVRSGSCF